MTHHPAFFSNLPVHIAASLAALAIVAGPSPGRAQSESVIYAFDEHSGYGTSSPLVRMGNAFYGTATFGGSGVNTGCEKGGCGTIFRINAGGHLKVLHDFTGGADGSLPHGGLVAMGGVLYGTAASGGTGGGTLFSITPQGSFAVLHSFIQGSDGSDPRQTLTVFDGTLYGVSSGGGAHNAGTIFSLAPSGSFAVLHSFDEAKGEGGIPSSPLLRVGNTFYGTTEGGGGASGSGTVYAFTLGGHYRSLHSFGGGSSDGSTPIGSLAALDGIIYGTTELGGTSDYGVAFAVAKDGSETVITNFAAGAPDMPSSGVYPLGGLIDVDGALFGTAAAGGEFGKGTVFELTPQGTETTLYSFAEGSGGAGPESNLLYSGGKFYGTTTSGGTGTCRVNSCGVAYAITP